MGAHQSSLKHAEDIKSISLSVRIDEHYSCISRDASIEQKSDENEKCEEKSELLNKVQYIIRKKYGLLSGVVTQQMQNTSQNQLYIFFDQYNLSITVQIVL